jgi:nucleotide-binding universal stress UspA family protein
MTVVVGYSPSAQGDAALRAAIREARRGKDDLVVASHAYHDAEIGRTVADDASVRAAIAGLNEGTGQDCPPIEVRACAEEDVGEFLLHVAEETDARLLVIGLRRKSRIGKLNLGASARRVVLSSACPVLTVKEDVLVAA